MRISKITTNKLLGAAERLHGYILERHWNGQALIGPDPGIRFNARVGRFIKSYLNILPWSDSMTYMQAQGYWILDNWLMNDLFGGERYKDLAVACSENLITAQRSDGCWEYPNPEWKGRIATVEGCFACLGLLESYKRLQHEPFLSGAKKWYQYLIDHIGFRTQKDDRMLAVNYFAHNNSNGGGVPNNSTLALWNLARLADVTGNDNYLTMAAPMVTWLKHVQLPSGELPYALGSQKKNNRHHFLCYQYNAFELMDLVKYFRITGDKAIWPVIERLAGYLSAGIRDTGAACYDCFHKTPECNYYTLALSQALSQLTTLGISDFSSMVEKGYGRVLSLQKADGNFEFYSNTNYGFLSDRRSYPRYLSMILNHLLLEFTNRTAVEESGIQDSEGVASKVYSC